MNAWLYARLSNDDDPEMDSLANQMEICREFALGQGYSIAGSSFDDNVSGMSFDRQGLDAMIDAVEAGQVNAILVKDLSRLGRHKIQTALFIDYLRQKNVAVISVTEKLNTLEEQDDLIVGIRGLMNEFYAKDIGNKIRHGYREKQKAGLVITPPFGYRKDKNTNCIYIFPEAAETVRFIYELYLQGYGQKEIARRLNALGRRTPKQFHDEQHSISKEESYRWTYQSVKNVLVEESYTGVLINHQTETHNGAIAPVPGDQQYRHENFFPVIIDREEWERVQAMLKANTRPYRGNTATHRYAGLLACGDCGSTFIAKNRYWNGNKYVAYVCNGYMHHGRTYCLSHSIRESELDARVQHYAENLRNQWAAEHTDLRRLQRMWELNRPAIAVHLTALHEEVQRMEQEIDEILLEKIKSGG